MNTKELKSALLQDCETIFNNRLEKIQQTIAGIVESLDDESKSSAGDKHETGRAMLQIDRENAGKQLLEIEQLQALIRRIDISQTTDYVRLGSLVYTSLGAFFISISAGSITKGKSIYICVALKAPLGMLFLGKKKGDVVEFNDRKYTITSVA